jgi:uncharacterized damage-inducible protein DinB
MNPDYFRLLFEYNTWANGQILERTAEAPEADYFASRAGLSFGSLHATLVHIFVAEAVWLARWRGRPFGPGFASNAREAQRIGRELIADLPTLRQRWQEIEADLRSFVLGLADADVASRVTYRTTGGEQFSDPLAHQMAHLVNHGTQFRAEAAVRLTELGHSPGDLDLTVLLRERPLA